jgi:hypothetical protein
MQPARKQVEAIDAPPTPRALWSRRDLSDDQVAGAMALPYEPAPAATQAEFPRRVVQWLVSPFLALTRRLRRLFT